MPVRDVLAIQASLATPFEGYAVRRSPMLAPDVDRIVALVALLGTMLLSGIALGRTRATPVAQRWRPSR